MFPLSHMASVFPYILLAAFYIMLVIKSSEAGHGTEGEAKQTIEISIGKQNDAEDSSIYNKNFLNYAAIHTLNAALLNENHPPGAVYPIYSKPTLHKVYWSTGPGRAPPFYLV